MYHIISTNCESFYPAKTMNVAGNKYHNIVSSSFKDFVDSDEKRKQVYFLRAKNSDHVVYVENNKVARTEEVYDKPRTMKFGDKVYSNITSKLNLADKNYDTYVVEDPRGDFRKIRVRQKTGSVLDTRDVCVRALKRKIFGPIKRLVQILH